jgi:hypothetical protein
MANQNPDILSKTPEMMSKLAMSIRRKKEIAFWSAYNKAFTGAGEGTGDDEQIMSTEKLTVHLPSNPVTCFNFALQAAAKWCRNARKNMKAQCCNDTLYEIERKILDERLLRNADGEQIPQPDRNPEEENQGRRA